MDLIKTKLSWRQRLRGLLTGQLYVHVERPAYPVPVQRSVVGSWNGFTLALWQASNEHIKWAQELFKQEKFRDLLAVLSNASPAVDPKRAEAYPMELGRFLGYRQLLGVLLALPRFPEAAKPDVEPDYSAKEVLAGAMNEDALEDYTTT